ncbi:MAG: phytoene/squalene synthase family protein, partial [Comamonadaceae bacterium]
MNQDALYREAERTIANGSRSFAAASRLLDAPTRESTVLLYTWCRHCDDVIDGQVLGHGQTLGERPDAGAELRRLEAQTRAACEGGPVGHPAFQGLAEVVRRHGIPTALPMEHLAGFGMDVHATHFASLDVLLQYCWRVAGVVGVMMARVMGVTHADTLDRACDLGMAFQLTNIARDVLEDAAIGRVYLPADWLAEEGIAGVEGVLDPGKREGVARVAARLVAQADPYYRSARAGIADLPMRCAWSIATARGVYREIGRKVVRDGAQAWDHRIATTAVEKLWFVARGAAVALAAPTVARPARPAGMFRR